MLKLGSTQLWVHDQDVALEFWTTKVGLEVQADVTLPEIAEFRWPVVGAPGQDVGIVLMPVPGPPICSSEMAAQISDLTAKGGCSTIFMVTEDCQATYEELSARGVEFTDKPTQQPYGVDAAFRDPSGNNVRLTQLPG